MTLGTWHSTRHSTWYGTWYGTWNPEPPWHRVVESRTFVNHRLYTQCLTHPLLSATAVVEWFGAVQAQDHPGSLWALGVRTRQATLESVRAAEDQGSIVRSWPLRGTLHFTPARDLHWMLTHFSSRTIAAHNRRQEAELGIDAGTLRSARRLLSRVLAGGRRLTRTAVYREMEQAGITPAGQRGYHLLWRTAHEGLICFGPLAGKQPTFVLLDEWVPDPRNLSRDEALTVLAERYFRSHGPAGVADFQWWAGITRSDANAGLEAAKPRLERVEVEGKQYWLAPSPATRRRPMAYLLPPWDEFTVAYRDRSALLASRFAARLDPRLGLLGPGIMISGRIVGTWSRAQTPTGVVVTLRPFGRLSAAEKDLVARAAARYGEFLGTPVRIR